MNILIFVSKRNRYIVSSMECVFAINFQKNTAMKNRKINLEIYSDYV